MKFKMFSIIRVAGQSMLPHYREGDYLFVTRFFKPLFLKIAKDIVFSHAKFGLLLKRVAQFDKSRQVLKVYGTAKNSINSKEIGDVHFDQVEGVVIHKF